MTGNCPICGMSRYTPFRMNLLRCKACGLVVNRGIWAVCANENLDETWFETDNKSARSPWTGIFERWNNLRTLRRITSFSMPGKRMLEIGVGSGSFSNLMKSSGYVVQGCDLSKSICSIVERKYGIPMHHGHVWQMFNRQHL